jgi:hypothetical protein
MDALATSRTAATTALGAIRAMYRLVVRVFECPNCAAIT